MEVKQIDTALTKPWILERHYARRMPPITYAFGGYENGVLIGIVTYGTPVSSSLRSGIAGSDNIKIILELNRLCCENIPNFASQIVGRSLRLINGPRIIVSYADTDQGHIGYVYQATNFLYTGLSAKRTDWKIKGMEHLHGATVADMSRGKKNRAQWMREKFGDKFYLHPRPRKHRYIKIIGNKWQKKNLLSQLRYPILPYPKSPLESRSISPVT